MGFSKSEIFGLGLQRSPRTRTRTSEKLCQQEMSRQHFICRDISYCPTGNIPTLKRLLFAVGIFPVAQQEISRHAKSVGTFPIGVVGTYLVGCVGISTASVSGHFYRPFSITLGMWSTSFYLGNFLGPTIAGFLVEAWGFRQATVLFFSLFLVMIFVDIIELLYNIKQNKKATNTEYAQLD
jgi:MFS family permease